MPEITRRDVMLLLTMALAIVSMSMVFPALGITNETVSSNEIPEFSIEQNRFDIAGQFPDDPGTPSSGTMYLNASEPAQFSPNQLWLTGSTDGGGFELVLIQNSDDYSEAQVRLSEWNSSGQIVGTETVNLTGPGDRAVLTRNGWEVLVEATDNFDGNSSANAGYYEITYNVRDQPQVGGDLGDRLPLVGGIFDTADALAGIVGWLGSILYWIGQTSFEIVLNVTGMLYDVFGYLIGLVTWMSTTYTAIVAAGSGWVSVFAALPGIIFSALLAKFVVVGIGLLPTT